MTTIQMKYAATGGTFLVIFLTGLWLTSFERPYPVLLLTLHKLIAAGILVFLVMTVYRINKETGLSTVGLVAAGFTVVVFISTILSGGYHSAAESVPQIIQTMHLVLPFATVASTLGTLYLMLSHHTT